MSILDSASFVPLQNLVAQNGIKFFVETNANGSQDGAEVASRLGLHAFICAGERAEALHASFSSHDIYNADPKNFLKDVLPLLKGTSLFWMDPNEPEHNELIEMIQQANMQRCEEVGTENWFTIPKAEYIPTSNLDRSEPYFDRNWAGPEELKPLCYRSQLEKDIWYSVVVENEYRLGNLEPNDVVIDIGANIGAFSYLAYQSGSRKIYSFEIDAFNIEGAYANLAGKEDGVELYNAAVVRGDSFRSPQYFYEGRWDSFSTSGQPVDSISLDQILEPHESVRFLKTDCEGGEWPILYTSQHLHKVQEIAGEYHLDVRSEPETQNLPYEMSTDGLSQFLSSRGFVVTIEQHSNNTGNFYAKRSNVQRDTPGHNYSLGN